MPKEKFDEKYGIFNIPPFLIKPNPCLARCDFSDTSLLCLADSIRRYGILQPLNVRLENGKYELVTGERRLRAAMLLHLKTVPCIISEDGTEAECLSVVENLQREKLTVFDEARAIKRIYEKNGRSAEKTAEILSVGETELCAKLRLCEFSRAEMQALTALGLSEKQALLFLDVPAHIRYYTIKLCAEKEYTYTQTKALCEAISETDGLFPDDLERFAENVISDLIRRKEIREDENHSTKVRRVILKDLRAFEISLEKICKVLESAGCRTSIAAEMQEKGYTYTVKVETENKNG